DLVGEATDVRTGDTKVIPLTRAVGCSTAINARVSELLAITAAHGVDLAPDAKTAKEALNVAQQGVAPAAEPDVAVSRCPRHAPVRTEQPAQERCLHLRRSREDTRRHALAVCARRGHAKAAEKLADRFA